jgi:alcohol dehydrogenase class IV
MDFNYYIPTRIVSGRGCVKQNAELLSKIGKKAFLMTGPSSAQKNGSLEDMKQALDSQGIAYQHYNKVKPNPSLQDVREASQVAKEAGADFVIAIGGGSPMDAAKAVAVLTACDVSDEDLLALREFPAVLPLVTIPTTSGTGSEVTPYSILTNDSLETKSFLNSHQIYPVLSFLDARYTMALPKSITNATAVDALSHSVEGFLAVRSTAMSRVFALESLRLLGKLLIKTGDRGSPQPGRPGRTAFCFHLGGFCDRSVRHDCGTRHGILLNVFQRHRPWGRQRDADGSVFEIHPKEPPGGHRCDPGRLGLREYRYLVSADR